MSPEMLTTIISAGTFLIALGAGFGWMIQRADRQLETLEQRLGARIDAVDLGSTERDRELVARLDGVEAKLSERIDAVERELVEVKIAIARLEGPPPRLITSR